MDESRPAAQSAPWTAGAKIADRYMLVERIAGGGMGDVWRGQDEILGRTVAIKVLRSEHAEDEDFRERLRREARAAGSISHPGVVPVYDYGEEVQDNGQHLSYLVMEYIDGPSLSTELRGSGKLGSGRTLAIIEQTAEALQAAHDAGVVHRDIKPGNILLTPDGDVKITDFGIARSADSMPMTRTGTLTGTAQYISPEQAGGRPATAASDIYSLGVVAYRCLTGGVPFAEGNEITIAIAHLRDDPPDLPADVPAGVRGLVMMMLAKDPEDRPASAGALAAMARELILSLDDDGEPTRVLVGAVTEPARTQAAAPLATSVFAAVSQSPRRPSRFQTIGVLAALVLLAGAGVMALQGGDVTTPSLVGQQQAAAQQLLAE
ncbi:MAG: serine/threonine protein kinase, partial [Propionibacteriales bacterium]|nr:serine/threonine protein kinase [Propionibacteriales bacterium]